MAYILRSVVGQPIEASYQGNALSAAVLAMRDEDLEPDTLLALWRDDDHRPIALGWDGNIYWRRPDGDEDLPEFPRGFAPEEFYRSDGD